ncbi:flagellar export chaperone FliS [Desulfovibrio sp. OttesenSCG-928-G15]|nr:flagellar export chaperone FliS [Desulfovibrio sp. OttesenSCG-928-G15]
MQRGTAAYLQTKVTTTSQGDIVVILFDGALKFLTQAKELLAVNDMAGKGMAISKTLDIINELDSTLNMEKGGDIAANLHGLYSFCTNHLVRANLKKDVKMIDEVVTILTGLRTAWAEIVALPEAQAAAQEAASNIRANTQPQTRTQVGFSSAGTPAPGANARIRAMYAKENQVAQAAMPSQAASELTEGQTPEQRAQTAPEPGQKPAPKLTPEQRPAATQAADGEAKQPAPANVPPVSQIPPAANGYGGLRAKAGMYSRFSQG